MMADISPIVPVSEVDVAVAPESDMAQVAALMLRRRFNHVPVVNPDGEILGICTSQDVLKHVLQRLDSKGD